MFLMLMLMLILMLMLMLVLMLIIATSIHCWFWCCSSNSYFFFAKIPLKIRKSNIFFWDFDHQNCVFCGYFWIAQSEFDGSNFEDFVSSSFPISASTILFYSNPFLLENLFTSFVQPLDRSCTTRFYLWLENWKSYLGLLFDDEDADLAKGYLPDSYNCSIGWLRSSCRVLTKYRHSETADYNPGGSRDQN